MNLKNYFICISFLLLLLNACTHRDKGEKSESQEIINDIRQHELPASDLYIADTAAIDEQPVINPMEARLDSMGLVDVQHLDSTIRVEIKYATEDNFMGKDIYNGFDKAYLQPDVAIMLVKSQQFLKTLHPEYSLVVYDAARSRSAQQVMWEHMDAPFEEKVKFLSNPANGSIHNFGAAVDVSILDGDGRQLEMGTDYDYMGELAHPVLEEEMVNAGLLSPGEVENRKLLRKVMRHSGFWGIQTEWWHFNACTRDQAREKYPIIE